jgi:hypothetical protein
MSMQPNLPQQATMELAMTAASAERSNRPRRLIILALLLLVGATVYTLLALGARAAATSRVAREAGELANLRIVVSGLTSLTAVDSSDEFKPNTTITQTLRERATALGLPDPGTTTDENTTIKAEGFVFRRYNSRIEGVEADALLHWMNDTTSGPNKIPGLQLYSVSLTPGRTLPPPPGHAGWNLRAVFSRWERKQ